MATKPKPLKLEVSVQVMKQVGQKETQLMEADAKRGITQEPMSTKTSPYKSETYKKYKQNVMNRFTDRTGTKGNKIAAYEGQSVHYTQTAIKDYHLTGKLYEGLHIDKPKVNEVTVAFMPKDINKILGARESGDELVGLNNKNINIIRDMLVKLINKKLGKWAKDDLNLTVG
jgi:hypothetical protein